jgi:uncharacterized protein (TIGR02246 family)
MRHAKSITLPAMFAVLSCVSLASEKPAGDAKDLATRFVAAWNTHDAAAFGALMAVDADWVTASGIRLAGRDRIQAYLGEEHSTWAKHTIMRASNIRVRALDAKTAVVLFEWEIETPGNEGAAPTISRGNNLFVVAHETRWSIVAGQVARTRAP